MNMNQSSPLETCFFIKNAVEQTPPVFVANIITSVLDLLVAISATLSNALIVYVIWKNRSLCSPSNTLMGCLAVTDLLVGSLVAPLNVLTKIGETVNNGELYCVAGVIFSFIGWISVSLSFLTLAVISVERYLAIRLHLTYIAIITTKKIITVLAFFCFLVVAITLFRFWDNKETIIRPIFITVSSMCFVLTVFCYSAIYVSVRKHRKQILNQVSVAKNTRTSQARISVRVPNSPTNAARAAMARQKTSTLTMFYILIFFLLCFLPLFAYQIVVVILNPTEDDQSVRLVYRFACSFSMLNSALNPASYCLRIDELREAVVNFVKKSTKILNN